MPRGEDPRVLNQITQFRLEQLPPEQAQVVLVFLLLVGIVYCFVGYAILRFVLALTGFLIAGTAAAVLGGWFSQGNLLAMAASALFGGACGAMALSFLYRAGVFIVGCLGALLLAFSLLFEGDASFAPVLVVVFGLVGGILALFLERPVMKLATAAIGGFLTSVSGLFLLVNNGVIDKALQERLSPHATLALAGAWMALTIFGAAFQFSQGKPAKKKGKGK